MKRVSVDMTIVRELRALGRTIEQIAADERVQVSPDTIAKRMKAAGMSTVARRENRPLTEDMVREHYAQHRAPSIETLADAVGLTLAQTRVRLQLMGGVAAILRRAPTGMHPAPVEASPDRPPQELLLDYYGSACFTTAGTGLSGPEWDDVAAALARRGGGEP